MAAPFVFIAAMRCSTTPAGPYAPAWSIPISAVVATMASANIDG
jgi:hypothetical protein